MYEGQDETGRAYDNQIGLENNLVQERNVPEEGQFPNNGLPNQTQRESDNSFDKYVAKIHDNPKFSEKEKEFNQKIDNFVRSKTGKSISAFSGYMVDLITKKSAFSGYIEPRGAALFDRHRQK